MENKSKNKKGGINFPQKTTEKAYPLSRTVGTWYLSNQIRMEMHTLTKKIKNFVPSLRFSQINIKRRNTFSCCKMTSPLLKGNGVESAHNPQSPAQGNLVTV